MITRCSVVCAAIIAGASESTSNGAKTFSSNRPANRPRRAVVSASIRSRALTATFSFSSRVSAGSFCSRCERATPLASWPTSGMPSKSVFTFRSVVLLYTSTCVGLRRIPCKLTSIGFTAAYMELLSLMNVAGPLVAEVSEETWPVTCNATSARLGSGTNSTRTVVDVRLWPWTGNPSRVSFTLAYSGSCLGISRLSNSPLIATRTLALR